MCVHEQLHLAFLSSGYAFVRAYTNKSLNPKLSGRQWSLFAQRRIKKKSNASSKSQVAAAESISSFSEEEKCRNKTPGKPTQAFIECRWHISQCEQSM